MTTHAVFTGKDGSLGYHNQTIYTIRVHISHGKVWVDCAGHVSCPYDTLVALTRNWQFVP